jgi:hypothetical protein
MNGSVPALLSKKKPNTIVTRCLGTDYTTKFSYLPADGTCGGVLHACRAVVTSSMM